MGTTYPYVVDANTLALVNFEENTGTTAADDTANNYDFTLSNSAAWSSTHKWGDYAFYPNAAYNATQATLLDTPPAALTVEMFVNFDVNWPTGGSPLRLFGKYNIVAAKDDRLYSLIYDTSGVWTTVMTTAADGGKSISLSSTTTAWTAGTWYHLAVTYGATGAHMYVNGIEEDSDAGTWIMANGTHADFYLGTMSDNNLWFDGKIDEFRVSDVQRTDFTGPAPAVGGMMTPRTKWWGDI